MASASPATSRPRVSAKNILRLLALYALLWLACVQLVLWFGTFTDSRRQLQSLAYPALLLLLHYSPPAHRLWQNVSPLARWSAAALLILAVNAQLVLRNKLTYPLSCWTMYTGKTPIPLLYHRIVTVDADGARHSLDLTPHASSSRALLSLLADLTTREQTALDAGDTPAAARHHAHLQTLLDALAARITTPGRTRLELLRVNLAQDGSTLHEEVRATSTLRRPPEPSR